ncbi:AAA family ATPase [Streptomyces fumanus]|uniref:Orc1-like AAA ATPase domain-containing protein n=1 Tax=Streptomyces fumanus TaxID=67302 RepID=A0A919B1F5_9ACTN|nr:AAA family ATPase [Streptomyces fumanus]GHF34439.1 hypothetical protein GCM10018772_70110 [Streptomyces fumanus]
MENVISTASRAAGDRKRVFVGRQEELELFREVAGDTSQLGVFYVHGPGGVGKSSLLRRFVEEARGRGRTVVEVDGRWLDPSPAAFEAAVGAVPEASVLVIDTFERCQGLEEWLRERYLPALPHDTTVVVAGREAPSSDWYLDSAWDDTLHVIPLGDLTHEDALHLIRARGVPPHLHESVISFAGRYPLALSLTAAVVSRRMASSMDWEPTPNVVEMLLRRLVGTTPSPMHRHALEVCAHAMTTSEELLRDVFGEEDAVVLFEWLRGLPFVESGQEGVYPHDVVREALDSDLRWRDFTGYRKMHYAVRDYAVRQVRSASGPAVLMAARAANYLLHHGPFKMAYHSWRGNGEVYETPYRPQDRPTLLSMAATARDGAPVTDVEYWLERQPHAFRLYWNSATGEPLGFLAHLACEEFTAEDAAADPVVAALRRDHSEALPAPGSGVLRLARYLVQRDGKERPSPAFDLMRLTVLADWLRTDRLAWSGRVLSDRAFWEKEMAFLGHRTVDTGRTPDGRPHTVFVMDWQTLPVDLWLETLSRRMLFGPDTEAVTAPAAPETAPGTSPSGGPELSDEQWEEAVREVFRAWRHEDVLAASPLLRLLPAGTPRESLELLRGHVLETVESLRADLTTAKYHHALTATYLGRPTTQRGAAARLGTPFSTYRRHLDNGLAETTVRLRRRLTPQ